MWIALEGSDGCGKTTVLRELIKRSQQHQLNVESGRQPHYNITRRYLANGNISNQALLALLHLDSVWHFERVVEPCLKQGKIYISDRCKLSAYAYQGVGKAVLDTFAPWPDRIFWLDLPLADQEKRVSRRQLDAMERRGRDFYTQVNQRYYNAYTNHTFISRIDATQSVDWIAEKIFTEILDATQKY